MSSGTQWVGVCESEGDDPIEVPTEPDGTLLLTSITAQFAGTTGLKFRNAKTGGFRGVRCVDGRLHPPNDDGTWGEGVAYLCVKPGGGAGSQGGQKRKADEDAYVGSKSARSDVGENPGEEPDTCDLIVLGLPYKTTENEMRKYFSEFGEVMMCQLKTQANGVSKGFGFVRFRDPEVQNKVIMTRHMVEGRWCDVKIPASQEPGRVRREHDCKIFVARLTESITAEDLKNHFEAFGKVTDVFYPKPFRGFAFVTFVEAKVAQSLMGKDHLINGVSVHIGLAAPKPAKSSHSSGDMGGPTSGGFGSGNDRYGSGGLSSGPWSGGRGGRGGGAGGPGIYGNYPTEHGGGSLYDYGPPLGSAWAVGGSGSSDPAARSYGGRRPYY